MSSELLPDSLSVTQEECIQLHNLPVLCGDLQCSIDALFAALGTGVFEGVVVGFVLNST